ncbi:hypothetical protein SERLA73DRAFT_83341 [Serpula lacrymans var. lacrymans S7.3]|uniref:Large ribosomal subunit protein bL32m n=2 Tax=Serpula lacrymans var. lacrymans TaxID=341189 RepID=F8PJ43_SERL3|nr:uncharacterized protein SERLADRAFT_456568 [Serpula lacrymans var. lacrymans S7.9]EGO03407.1 hypothetical protein SERLA73DRAFT_83341 [Serpula lacrymans var. lacrymans S7.3]EGO29175.1 hypothetical protein SERLADRAFT_456568 [Serpula lacrymans var. lacrymans S7.9]
MTSIAFHPAHQFLSALRAQWSRSLATATILPSFLSTQQPFNWSIPRLESLLELFPSIVLAVPKKKVSHSRKSMRSANKGLKDKMNIVNCPACGAPKLAHHLCQECYKSITARWKLEANRAEKRAKRKPVSGGSWAEDGVPLMLDAPSKQS